MAHFFHFLKICRSPTEAIKSYSRISHIFRSLTTGRNLANNYEGDGKTIVTILNREYKHLIMIDTFSNHGFRINNGIFAVGPLVVFPRTLLQWNVNDINSVTPESLSLFTLLEPKLDILIIGTGDTRILPSKDTLEFLKSNKINIEVLTTQHACATFNFLNVEGRLVAGALIPPKTVQIFEDEVEIMDTVDAIDDYYLKPPKYK